ncbi:MAG: acyloxyacyl hydrolase [Rikenellaceae bacterium]
MMKPKYIYIVILLLFSIASLSAEGTQEQEKSLLPVYVSFNSGAGWVIPTNDFLQGENQTYYSTNTLKYAFTSRGDSWQDLAYGMPYYGVGLSQSLYGRDDELGKPVSLFLFQGATISQFTPRFSLNYELELGLSMNWKYYDPFTNPDNLVIGSSTNVHFAGNIYFKWRASDRVDIHSGASIAHFSNGTSQQPNNGLNKGGAFVEVAYNFNHNDKIHSKLKQVDRSKFTPHFEQDVQFILSTRNVKIDTLQTNMPDVYTDKQFDVYGLNYYIMRASRYNYRYGIGVEGLYDESREAIIYNKEHPDNGNYYTVTELGDFKERLSLGVSARGELVLPYYSIFFDVGVTILNRDKSNPLLSQALGAKVYLANNLFGTFGVKTVYLSESQFLYWSLGYTINSKRNHWFRDRR